MPEPQVYKTPVALTAREWSHPACEEVVKARWRVDAGNIIINDCEVAIVTYRSQRGKC